MEIEKGKRRKIGRVEEYFAKKTADRNEAIENDVLKEQHPSMPINQERQTRVTFGGSNKD
jgi:hypothetical protein